MFPIKDSVPSRSFPFGNTLLIAANFAAFYYELRLDRRGLLEPLIRARALVPAAFWDDPGAHWQTVYTAMFLHGGWMHVIGNMWYLWIFGRSVEGRLGPVSYLAFYLLAGTLASLSQAYFFPESRLPMIGASGAIAGVLGAYFLLYPGASVLTLIPFGFFSRIVEIPALLFLVFWFLLQAFQGVGSLALAYRAGETGGVAWWAHAGGFVAGAILIPFFPKRRR
jgi:membrane associated rhomboid family serine protease